MPPKHKKWNPNDMIGAINAVRSKQMGYLKASKTFGVPKGTVERYAKSNKTPEELVGLSIGRKPVLSPELENELVQYALSMEERFFGLRARDVKRLAFQLAIRNNLAHPFNGENKSAGKKWLRLFFKRHPQLSMRTPQGMSAARIKGFTAENVSTFFDLYEPEYNKLQDPFQRIFNVDETGITVVQHKHSKVISLRGKKQVSSLTSAERGKLITVVTCMNASGVYVPPLFIFPRKNMKAELMIGAPSGAVAECHISGWVQTDIFTRWFKHFIKFTKPNASDPVLLVLDGHYSHTRNIELIDLAKKNHVTIICLPPHSTNKMQPLDVAFMSPLKTYYAQEIENWLRENKLSTVSPYAVAGIFGKAYNRAAALETSCNGFRKTGLVPLNRNIFRDHEFGVHEVEHITADHPPIQGHETEELTQENLTDSTNLTEPDVEIEEEEQINNTGRLTASSSEENDEIVLSPVSASVREQRTPSPVSATSKNILVSPADICPLPSYKKQSTTKVNSRTGKAAIITLTPYKDDLQESSEKRKKKPVPKRNLGSALEPKPSKQKKSQKRSNKNQPNKDKMKSTEYDINQPSTSGIKKLQIKPKRKRVNSSSSSESDGSVKLKDSSSDESGGSDAECLFCMGRYSEDKHGEKWAICIKCGRWAHEDCGEIQSDTFICSICEGSGFFE